MTINLQQLAVDLRTWANGLQLAAMTSTNSADAKHFADYARDMEATAARCEGCSWPPAKPQFEIIQEVRPASGRFDKPEGWLPVVTLTEEHGWPYARKRDAEEVAESTAALVQARTGAAIISRDQYNAKLADGGYV